MLQYIILSLLSVSLFFVFGSLLLEHLCISHIKDLLNKIYSSDDSYNFNPTLTFKLSTVFFNAGLASSTYVIMITSDNPVPRNMTAGLFFPGTGLEDSRKTFAFRIFTNSELSKTIV